MKKTDVMVLNNIGGGISVWVDHLPSVGESVMGYNWLRIQDLAKGGNVAVALSRLGLRTAIIGKIGFDAQGNQDVEWMQENGVILDGLIQTPEVATGQGIAINEKNTGRNLIVTGESSSKALTLDEVKEKMALFQPAKYYITGFEVREELVLAAARIAKFYGSQVVLNPSPLPKNDIGQLDCVDYFIVNRIEALKLLEMDPEQPSEARVLAEALQKKYAVPNVIVTLGGEGYAGKAGDKFFSGKAIQVEPVLDTCGAGDAFLAAMVAGLSKGWDLEKACAWANKYAARTVLFEGTLAGYSTVEELEDFFETKKHNKCGFDSENRR